jgi:glycosyltransferase involved in cell wall biosynthesis
VNSPLERSPYRIRDLIPSAPRSVGLVAPPVTAGALSWPRKPRKREAPEAVTCVCRLAAQVCIWRLTAHADSSVGVRLGPSGLSADCWHDSNGKEMAENKISIITASLNAAPHIESAIESVAGQSYPRIEHVIIDGGSTDGTLQIIERHRDSVGYLVSEPDSGIYNAMNKGIKAASGDILFFLNADDRLCDDRVVADVMSVFNASPELEVVYGNLLWDLSGKMVRKRQPSSITRASLAGATILHQTVFAKRHVFEATGGFSEEYKVVSDYDWMMKVFIRDRCKYRYYDRDIAVMGTRGLSWTSTDWERERIQAMRAYFTTWEILRYRVWPRRMQRAKKVLRRVRNRLPR